MTNVIFYATPKRRGYQIMVATIIWYPTTLFKIAQSYICIIIWCGTNIYIYIYIFFFSFWVGGVVGVLLGFISLSKIWCLVSLTSIIFDRLFVKRTKTKRERFNFYL